LRDLDFAPQWSSSKPSGPAKSTPPEAPRDRTRKGAPDRRPARRDGPPGDSGPRGKDSPGRGRDRRPVQEPFRPVVQFSVYPEDEPFDLLVQSIRSSLKVYELFEITRLILDKTDRMVVVISPLEESAPPLFESIPDRQIFQEEERALKHAAGILLASVFEEREESVEPPKVNFSSVLRCKISGKYLPPKSYHRFHELLVEHQRLNCPNASVERVEKGLEAVADEGAVQQWLQSMSQRSVFRLRGVAPVEAPAGEESPGPSPESPAEEDKAPEDPPPAPPEPESPEVVLDSREAALSYLVRKHRDQLIRETRQARVPARALVEGEDEAIRKSFEAFVEQQKRFPLDTANNVRMKLRKAKFFIFKKGKKGISYVSAVRRRNRPSGVVFADSVEKIIQLLEAHPETKLKELPALLHPESAEAPTADSPRKEGVRQLVQDLKWLKSEGYLYEYSDGTLDLHPKESPGEPEANREETEAEE